MAHHRRRRKPFVGCCSMCSLRSHDGTRRRVLTRRERAAALDEREQVAGYVAPEHRPGAR